VTSSSGSEEKPLGATYYDMREKKNYVYHLSIELTTSHHQHDDGQEHIK